MTQTSQTVGDLSGGWDGIVASKLTPEATKVQLTNLLDSKCCISHDTDTTDKDFIEYNNKHPMTNKDGPLDWQTYKLSLIHI